MYQTFLQSLHLSLKELVFNQNDRILIACSGGLDSTFLAVSLYNLKYPIGLAHVNHHQRGKESDDDMEFVRNLAMDLDIPFYCVHLDTNRDFPEKSNFQEAARNFRYSWLQSLLIQENYQYIATAHHLDDQLETVLMRLFKNQGVEGLHGISSKRGKIIRPLLGYTREKINELAIEINLTWREDSSNVSNKYQRNWFRNEMIPILKKEFPFWKTGFEGTLKNLKNDSDLIKDYLNFLQTIVLKNEKDYTILDTNLLINYVSNPVNALFHLLKNYGFNAQQVQNIFDCKNKTGTSFTSSSYKIMVDRNETLFIHSIESQYEVTNFNISELPFTLKTNHFEFKIAVSGEIENLKNDFWQLDFDKIKLPILIRNWKDGDKFYPLGMNGKGQKVKEYLTNIKVPAHKKKGVLIAETQNQIIGVLGFRMDERFKITSQTKKVIRVYFSY